MSTSGKLVPALIQVLGDKGNPIKAIPVLFNPEQYDLNKRVKYGEKDVPGYSTPVTDFVSGKAEKLSMRLFFDTSEQRIDVNAAMAVLDELVQIDGEQHEPPKCRFVWGSLVFKAVVTRLNKTFTKFLPTGQPVRVEVDVTFREYTPLKEQRDALPFFSPDTTSVREVTGDETLWLIADEEYGDPGSWRRIAAANDLANPRDLRPGQRLVIPEL